MNEEVASFLAETICHTANINTHYGNLPEEIASLDCKAAGHLVYCALCVTRYGEKYTFTAPESANQLEWLPTIIPPKESRSRKSATRNGREELNSILTAHSWRYREAKSDFLWRLLSSFQDTVQKRRQEQAEERNPDKRPKKAKSCNTFTSNDTPDSPRSSPTQPPSPTPLPVVKVTNLPERPMCKP
ncbi:hypothetical protein K435DRAFT_853467 [Dendrothele bispora CBS 962.96]|uniref:Uncharacterized protein n=1 Tax=Dendrothele bispora (strain CBS 962.96) TaxID=1314807 RepID=A0A4S8MGH0_DENBC|nr:hypothetical protein K435DRAFT_853467 [Dendrothele bispora CBS 962.96]